MITHTNATPAVSESYCPPKMCRRQTSRRCYEHLFTRVFRLRNKSIQQVSLPVPKAAVNADRPLSRIASANS